MDQASGGEDPNKPSKKKSGEDDGKNKKLNIHIKTLADDMRDRITSFRKQGAKKEKPLIQHPTDPLSPQAELPMPQPFLDERSMNLSEKEIIDLFEKMMEDMNLNEERKAPLRGKDLSTKREMVVQYISATAKSITGSKVPVEVGKEKKARHSCYQKAAVILSLVFLLLTICVFSLRHFWSPSPGKVYDHEYTAVVDGMETDSLMEIDPVHRVEIFRMGNDTDEILEVHDFKNGITGIRFSKHQRCYIKTQPKELPNIPELEAEDAEIEVGELETVEVKVEDSQVWVPSEEPITNHAFLLETKIWEVCRELPIHWIHPAPLRDAKFHDVEDVEDTPDEEVKGQRKARDVLDHVAVNDYRDIGVELTNALDEQGYCCQHCRRGYRHCQRYHEPLGGYWPYPYYYQGGRVICQIIMPCNWWIARMLGRV